MLTLVWIHKVEAGEFSEESKKKVDETENNLNKLDIQELVINFAVSS